MLQLYKEVDDVLLENPQYYYKKSYKHALIGVLLMFAIIGSICSGNVYEAFLHRTLKSLSKLYFNVTDLIILTMIANYVNTVLLLRQRLAILNQKLQMECEILAARTTHSESTVRYVPAMYIEELPHSVCSPQHLRSIRSVLREEGVPDKHVALARKIVSFKTMYHKIYKISVLMNAAYGVPVMFVIFTSFVNFIRSFHMLLLFFCSVFLPSRSTVAISISSLGFPVAWSLFYVAEAVVLAWTCDSASKEARRTTGVLQDLLLQSCLDKDASQQLEDFSSQTSRKKLLFSGGGFFRLDLQLLTSMCVSATSYVLVLLQFDVGDSEGRITSQESHI
ncbi:hypothetical protein PR048_004232 [Dryococelus australis]|uniref:Gustatory receptor n=1 Tax=Dryococelus australis TaxID=614101 RepID=A0ABQ9I4W9_9NEOP|nr:hypothetical protein PR048_004232 [Dryococelus australis]